jgi:hypothetical protein
MFKFLKSLFGGDQQLNQEAGVQIEQVPYKVEPSVVVDKVEAVNAQPIAKAPKTESKPAAITAAEKPAAKKPAAKKAVAKKPAAKKKSSK